MFPGSPRGVTEGPPGTANVVPSPQRRVKILEQHLHFTGGQRETINRACIVSLPLAYASDW